MIKIKYIVSGSLYKNNLFIEKNISNRNYNNISYLFDKILNKLISYKNREVYFASTRSIIGIMLVEMKSIKEEDLEDFFSIFQARFDLFDIEKIVFGGWYHYINKDINDIKGMTLHEFNLIINDDDYIKKYFRKVKLKKLAEL